jgi:hypothetical protein
LFNNPRGIAVNSSGYVYVADYANHRIQTFTPGGAYVMQWGLPGAGNGSFIYPYDIAVNSSGYVYVADTNNHRIQIFTPGGAYVTKWGSLGYGNGSFNYPYGIAVDSSNNVYVADSYNDRIQKFSRSFSAAGIGVFRNSTHTFYLDYNGNGVWNGASVDRTYNFGITGDIPATGDWNNDGKSEIGVFRPSTHLFYLDYNGNGAWNGAVTDRQYNFGISGDIPVTGDWNNDGKSEIGVFRNSTHLFYLDYNGNGAWNGAVTDRQYNFGISGDIPVSGDWNNDGISEIGVFRNSTHLFYLDYSGNGVWNGASVDRQYNFGIIGDMPISGDWN